MSKLKVYISGKISGLPIEEAQANFKNMQTLLEGLGYEAVNPFEVPVMSTMQPSWADFMGADIAELLKCDIIVFLENYKDSKGAMMELAVAKEMKSIFIVYPHEVNCLAESKYRELVMRGAKVL